MIFHLDRQPAHAAALHEEAAGRTWSYAELAEAVGHGARQLRGTPLVFLLAQNDAAGVAAYLACLEAGAAVCLIEPGQPEAAERLLAAYLPPAVLAPPHLAAPAGGGYTAAGTLGSYTLWRHETDAAGALVCHPSLALLLTTSGSTGSPKLVRLTRAAVEANAGAIAEYLALGPGECAVQSLPMHYSYGLSVINSHLTAGGAIALTQHSFLRPEFWAVVGARACTSFAGIPYMYETLARIRFQPARHASLRTYTQAGGALRVDLAQHFHAATAAAGARLFVMYGQTEATARIAYVPPARLAEKFGSIGIAIPGGWLSLAPVDGDAECTELIYEGPNAMMGYADGPAGLALGDELGGRLRTGDLARIDADGFYYLTGRLKRIAKLFGRRLSLEDLEHQVETRFPGTRAAAVERAGSVIAVFVEPAGAPAADIAKALAASLNVPPKHVEAIAVEALPRTSNGKKDYQALSQ
ncbi:MAG: AMP-binding protein [Bryobacterales bacterium]|nr:AMP-binding protein [Bryobacterales bacterium]